jgi:hypothetical protein
MKKSPTHQFMFLVRGASCDTPLSPEQMQAQMKEVYAWIDHLTRQGVMSAAQPLTPEARLVSGEHGAVTDGVYAESKEAVGGFFIVNCGTMEDAVGIARTCPSLKHGTQLEVRHIAELQCD